MAKDKFDPLAADYSPGAVDEKIGVRRVNAKPLMILGGGLSIFILVIALVAYDRSVKSQQAPAARVEKKAPATTTTFAKAAIGDHESGIIAPSETLTPPPELPPSDLATVADPVGQFAAPGASVTAGRSVPEIRPLNGDPQLRPPGQRSNQPNPRYSADYRQSEEVIEVDKDAEKLRELKYKQFENVVKMTSSAVAWDAHAKPRAGAGAARSGSYGAQGGREADLARIAALQTEIDAQGGDEGGAAASSSFQDKIAALKAASSMPPGASAGAGPGAPTGMGAAPAAGRNGLAKFEGPADRWRLDTQDNAPAPFQLTTGHIIPTILLTGINSELPGQIIAQVSQDIYDTATHKQLLIPRGTKVIGAYESDIVYGQASVMVAMQRLIYPDGKTRDIGSMQAADAAGNSGMRDQVDNHYVRIFGSSFLMSGITAGIALSQPNQSAVNQAPTARSALSESLGQQLGQTSTQLLSKNLNISPTLVIRPGYRFNIIVMKDLVFKNAYKPFDYKRNK